MPIVNFSAFSYYPSLLASYGELTGYGHLAQADKEAVLPIAAVSWLGFNVSFEQTIDRLRAGFGNNHFLLDLDHRPAPPPYEAVDPQDPEAQQRRLDEQRPAQAAYNARLEQALSSRDGFAEWREVTATFPNAIPVLQHRDFATEGAAILRQAARLSEGRQSIAIRVSESEAQDALPTIVQIISILERPEQLLIIYDAGQGRRSLTERAAHAVDFISSLTDELDVQDASRIVAALISNSFTASVLGHDELRNVSNLDRSLWAIARESFPFAYGDYATTARTNAHSAYIPSDSKPTAVYALTDGWLIYRGVDLNDPQGWIDGSTAILEHNEYDGPIPAWGQGLLDRAADNDLNGIDSARFWRAAKINLHIYRQLRYPPTPGSDDEAEWDEFL